ncbi:MAG TPA: outer membrane protein transport protein, partial [Bacteroidota bacterium]|nr:outer membrane protein transport protein [Bacteroidota bacterium]
MKNRGLKKGCALAVAALFSATTAVAGGFQITDQSARAMGIGGAVGATVGDPTAMHANPAILSFLEGPVFSLGATVIVPDERF